MKEPYWPRFLRRWNIERNSPLARFVILGGMDVVAWVIAWLLATAAITGLAGDALPFEFLAMSLAGQLVIGAVLGLYDNRYRIASGAELLRVGATVTAVFALCAGIELLALGRLELVRMLLVSLFAGVIIIFARQVVSIVVHRDRRPRGGRRIVVVGAGALGESLISQMIADRRSAYIPVALVDDDTAKRNLRLHGVPVEGTSDALASVVASTRADGVLVAIANAPAALFTKLTAQLEGTDVRIRTVPSLTELMSDTVDLASIRDIDVEDLMDRVELPVASAGASALVRGRRVLVTGAGGSIGSELCRRIHREGPAELVMLDRDESVLHSLSLTLYGRALMDAPDLALVDIRDREALDAVMERYRPEVVFHAAALKHLPMLESFPAEGWKTNVHGTLNVLRACEEVGVDTFVNVSTDKVAAPTSWLGWTKLIAERLTGEFARRTGRRYVSVRFGNVLGSRGSVLLAFQNQIAAGGPLTVTHPEVTRYFMTIPEACSLVLEAASEGSGGDTLILDMGQQVRIVDVARRMMFLSGRMCDIVYTGLRPGEKLHEDLFVPGDDHVRGDNERIWHMRVKPLAPADLPAAQAGLDELERCIEGLRPSAGFSADERAAEFVSGTGPIDGTVSVLDTAQRPDATVHRLPRANGSAGNVSAAEGAPGRATDPSGGRRSTENPSDGPAGSARAAL